MKKRIASLERKTLETDIRMTLCLDGTGKTDIETGIPFLDHMLNLTCAHGFFDLSLQAKGDLDIDLHHTVEDAGIVLGGVLDNALGDRRGINRYGYAKIPMDEALAEVAVDLSKRPYLVYHVPLISAPNVRFDASVAKEFFQALAVNAGMNLHIGLCYGENTHHILEAVFKAFGRALDQGVSYNERRTGVPSTKGSL